MRYVTPEISQEMKDNINRELRNYLRLRDFSFKNFDGWAEFLYAMERDHHGRSQPQFINEKTPREKKGLKTAVMAQLAALDDALRGLSQIGKTEVIRGLFSVVREDYPPFDLDDDDERKKYAEYSGLVTSSIDNLIRAVKIASQNEEFFIAPDIVHLLVDRLILCYRYAIIGLNPNAKFSSTPGGDLYTFVDGLASVMDKRFKDGVPNLRKRIEASPEYIK